jgi:hypothetical protein
MDLMVVLQKQIPLEKLPLPKMILPNGLELLLKFSQELKSFTLSENLLSENLPT